MKPYRNITPPKSPKLSDDAPATGSGGLTITDVMAAQGMVQSKAPLGFALFLAKVGVQDPQFAIEGLLNYAMALDNPTLNKLSEETRLQIIPYLVNFAFADYSRSAASKARCEHCAGTGFHNVLREVVKHSRSGESVIKEEWVKELCQHCHGKGEVSTACRGCKGKGIVLDEKEPGFMARLFIRFVGVAMETGLAVYQPHWRGFMSRSWYQT